MLADDLNHKLQNVEQETAVALAESAERLARERVLDPGRKPNPKSGNYHHSIKGRIEKASAFYIAELSSDVPYAGRLEFGDSQKKPSSKTMKKGFRVLGDTVEEAVDETERIFTEIFRRQLD